MLTTDNKTTLCEPPAFKIKCPTSSVNCHSPLCHLHVMRAVKRNFVPVPYAVKRNLRTSQLRQSKNENIGLKQLVIMQISKVRRKLIFSIERCISNAWDSHIVVSLSVVGVSCFDYNVLLIAC